MIIFCFLTFDLTSWLTYVTMTDIKVDILQHLVVLNIVGASYNSVCNTKGQSYLENHILVFLMCLDTLTLGHFEDTSLHSHDTSIALLLCDDITFPVRYR